MTATERLTILLADEDALRRDGLAAVLQGTPEFNIVAQCADGEQALNKIRALRPQLAVVDLNLPKLHGIELVRRVRSESLGTRIIVLSGTAHDEIVREVIRAGADGYLLKNGPIRHLVDAISYVRDGGQYFSPQLGRDGLDRHLLEETPRTSPAMDTSARQSVITGPETPGGQMTGYSGASDAAENDYERAARGPRYGRSRRFVRRASDSGRGRERIFDESGAERLEERDYEILDMMAEGIRPILDRLDEIDNRVEQMESGAAPVPSNVRGWLSRQLAETLETSGREGGHIRPGYDLETVLPKMIEEAVSARFQQMAGKLQHEIEETHLRTLESFVKNVQVKLVQRVSALETDMSRQASAMMQLREYSQRTEENLSRLIAGVDKLAQDLPKRLANMQQAPKPLSAATPVPATPVAAPRAAAWAEPAATTGDIRATAPAETPASPRARTSFGLATFSPLAAPPAPAAPTAPADASAAASSPAAPAADAAATNPASATAPGAGPGSAVRPVTPIRPPEFVPPTKPKPPQRTWKQSAPKIFWASVASILVLTGGGLGLKKVLSPQDATESAAVMAGNPSPEPKAPAKLSPPPPNADLKTKLSVAQEYMDRKEYSTAEDIYREALKNEPRNAEVLKLLASVLYREDKIEESAAVLDKLPKEGAPGSAKIPDIGSTP